MELADTCLEHFSKLEDPRIQNHNLLHHLSDILIIAVLATICGADGWVESNALRLQKKNRLVTSRPAVRFCLWASERRRRYIFEIWLKNGFVDSS